MSKLAKSRKLRSSEIKKKRNCLVERLTKINEEGMETRETQPSSRFTPWTANASRPGDVRFPELFQRGIAANSSWKRRVYVYKYVYSGRRRGGKALVGGWFPGRRASKKRRPRRAHLSPAAIVRGIRVIKRLLLDLQPLPETGARNAKKKWSWLS